MLTARSVKISGDLCIFPIASGMLRDREYLRAFKIGGVGFRFTLLGALNRRETRRARIRYPTYKSFGSSKGIFPIVTPIFHLFP
jgi:hypothetical protein